MSWIKKLKSGLSKSSSKISKTIGDIVTKRVLDDAMLEELEDALILSDMGSAPSAKVVNAFAKQRFNKEVDSAEVKLALAEEIAKILSPVTIPLEVKSENTPHVIMMVGVNGNGKTTTLGKLAQQYKQQGKNVMIAACDTFRAAAVEQVTVWGDRTGCPVVRGKMEADPASVAFAALTQAKEQNMDVLLIDTAGRLQNKKGLMEELAKISRVLKKIDESAPHDTVLVLDATTGQNAHSQAEAFKATSDITGLIVTKLDGTAKGGVVVALAEKFKLPIHAIGVGEGIEDLQPFEAMDYAKNLMGVEGE